METKKWSTEINGLTHDFQFTLKPKSKQQVLYIDGVPKILPNISFRNPDIDYCFDIDGHELHLVTSWQDCDLALDGVFLSSGLPYKKCVNGSWCIAFTAIYLTLFLAIIVAPKLIFNIFSMWIVLALPLTIAAVFATYRLSKSSFLKKRFFVKPIIYMVLMVLYLFLVLLYHLP